MERTQRGLDLSDRRAGDLGLRDLRHHLRPLHDSRRLLQDRLGPRFGATWADCSSAAGASWPESAAAIWPDGRIRRAGRHRHGTGLRGGHAGRGEMVWSASPRTRRRPGRGRLRRGGHLHFAAGQVPDRQLWHLGQLHRPGNLLRHRDRRGRPVACDAGQRLSAQLIGARPPRRRPRAAR